MLITILTISILYAQLNTDNPCISDEQWFALCEVESGNDPNSVGRDGASGPAQIRKICVDDVNRIVGKNLFSYEDRFDHDKSRRIFRIYTTHYAGEDAPFETRLRIWNGGPSGHKKKMTKSYVNRVIKLLE